MSEKLGRYLLDALSEIAKLDSEIIYLVMLLVVTVIVIDAVSLVAARKRREAGIAKRHRAAAIEGSTTLPIKNYVSNAQRLAGRPDAVVVDRGYHVPVERKPLAKKLRDRYVAQLLVYMRLIEEFEGKRPPHGYLILGQNARRVKIDNSAERQRWLQKMLDEMQDILSGKTTAVAKPEPRKCRNCPVRERCKFRADLSDAAS